MSALSPEEIARIREEERLRAEVRLEVEHEQARQQQRGTFAKTLALWLVLVLVFFGLWRVFSDREARETPAEARP
ncbi:MAG: hypothetical protein IT383_23080 [Deltaproteobacteria bacterium]|nr:hypothetical protein [Deltaproteobacteria bacterium]